MTGQVGGEPPAAVPSVGPTDGPTDGSSLVELVETFRRLRAECGWKAAQTHRSLARYLLEESHEAVEAIEALDHGGDPAHLREELGDVLLQVYLHAAIAAEAGWFDMEDVAAGLQQKMLRRNPHVFGDLDETDPDRINESWEAIKAGEKQASGRGEDLLDGIPLTLPSLHRAAKVLERLERAGRPAAPDPASADVGERLLALVDEARAAGVDPEQALRDAVRRIGP
jgi:XTP/dITP diphosphohydrolase